MLCACGAQPGLISAHRLARLSLPNLSARYSTSKTCRCTHIGPHVWCGPAQRRTRQQRCSRRPIQTHAVGSTSVLFAASTVYTVSLFALMLLVPRRRLTVGIMSSDWIFVPLSVVYITLLLQSWTPDTLQLIMPGSLQAGLTGCFEPQFFPKLQGIQQLFSQMITAASLWIHLLSINLFAARAAYTQGLHHQIPARHSILLSMVFGPLGLLSNLLTHVVHGSPTPQSAAAQT